MSILQFLRILWAYKLLIVLSTMIAVANGATALLVIKPRYEAQSRVLLDVIKPDPVTGQVMATNFLKAYTTTQVELIKDPEVARRVVADLKWASSPEMQKLYASRDSNNGADFNGWAIQQVVDGTEAGVLQGSNILAIKYSSGSPDRAKSVAEGLRQAYLDLNLQSRRDAATRNAEWYEQQAEKARGQLMQAEANKAAYERESGIVLQDNLTDIDTARLAALAGQGPAPIYNAAPSGVTPTTLQLAGLDSQLSLLEKTLGPNHPQLIDLRRQRELLLAQIAREQNTQGQQSSVAAASARASEGMLEAQKAKVMAQREEVERLRLMQGEIDLRRLQYNNAVGRAAQLRQEAEVAETGAGVTPMGVVLRPVAPVFPNKLLFIAAAVVGGLGVGLLSALVLEFLGRRVRSPEDLASATQALVLAVVRNPKLHKRPWWSPDRLLPRRVGWRTGAVGA